MFNEPGPEILLALFDLAFAFLQPLVEVWSNNLNFKMVSEECVQMIGEALQTSCNDVIRNLISLSLDFIFLLTVIIINSG